MVKGVNSKPANVACSSHASLNLLPVYSRSTVISVIIILAKLQELDYLSNPLWGFPIKEWTTFLNGVGEVWVQIYYGCNNEKKMKSSFNLSLTRTVLNINQFPLENWKMFLSETIWYTFSLIKTEAWPHTFIYILFGGGWLICFNKTSQYLFLKKTIVQFPCFLLYFSCNNIYLQFLCAVKEFWRISFIS